MAARGLNRNVIHTAPPTREISTHVEASGYTRSRSHHSNYVPIRRRVQADPRLQIMHGRRKGSIVHDNEALSEEMEVHLGPAPIGPTRPVQPVLPVQTMQPGQPGHPMQPMQSNQPGYPTQSMHPMQPLQQ